VIQFVEHLQEVPNTSSSSVKSSVDYYELFGTDILTTENALKEYFPKID